MSMGMGLARLAGVLLLASSAHSEERANVASKGGNVTLTVSVNPAQGANVRVTPPNFLVSITHMFDYAAGTDVELFATNPIISLEFDSWSGDVTGDQNPVTVTMDSDKSVTGNFRLRRFTLTTNVDPPGAGTIELDPPPGDDGKYDFGTQVELVALSNDPNKPFVRWSGANNSTENRIMIGVTSNTSVTAHFSTGLVNLTLDFTPKFSAVAVTSLTVPAFPPFQYHSGTPVTVEAFPARSWQFEKWTGDIASFNNPLQFIIENDMRLTAHFVGLPEQVLLTVLIDKDEGRAKIDSVANSIRENTTLGFFPNDVIFITAHPKEGFRFKDWRLGGASNQSNPLQFNITEDTTLEARFKSRKVAVTLISKPPEGGAILAEPAPDGDGRYKKGTEVKFTAVPSPGFHIGKWQGDATEFGSGNPIVIDVTKDVTIVHKFKNN